MKKKLWAAGAAVCVLFCVLLAAGKKADAPYAAAVTAGAAAVRAEELTYPGGTGLQVRLARWYNLNLAEGQPEVRYQDAYPTLLRSDGGCMGYVVLGDGDLTYPLLHDGTDGLYCFAHDSGTAIPVSHRGERTVLRWQGTAGGESTAGEAFSLKPGSYVTLFLLDRKLTYAVTDSGTDDGASCLELVFPLERGNVEVIVCKCIQMDTVR